MKTCCQNIPEITCHVVDINKRIVPLQYNNSTLHVNSPMTVMNSLTIGGATISTTPNGNMDLPVKTLINGVPLVSSAFSSDVIPLPTNTLINGYIPITEQFFYFFTPSPRPSDLLNTFLGYIVNGRTQTTSGNPSVDTRGFPFIVPEDCVLTSLKLAYILTPGLFGTPGDASISLIVSDSLMNTFFTGVSFSIPAPASTSTTFRESQLEYYVKKGDSVGIFVSGTAQFQGGIVVFATLGYKIIPPGLLTSPYYPQIPRLVKSSASSSSSFYNRFPFNNLMNFRRKFPITFEEQIEKITLARDSSDIYGRVLTPQDYEAFSVPISLASEILVFSIENFNPLTTCKQDAIVFLLTNKKENGWFVDISSFRYPNTLSLETDHHWQGILSVIDPVSFVDEGSSFYVISTEYLDIFDRYSIPSYIDYLSFDLDVLGDNDIVHKTFESLYPVLELYRFGVITIRHNGDRNLHSKCGNVLIYYNYVRIFSDVMMEIDGEWQNSEDWYVSPELLDSVLLETIVNYPEQTQMIPWTRCIDILTEIYNRMQ